jgi:hypothetical protein
MSLVRSTPATKCAASGCPRAVVGAPWSLYCRKHNKQANRYGAPNVNTSTRGELRRYREPISRVLAKYSESDAVQKALHVADDILLYRPRADFTVHYKIQEQMRRLRAEGVTARELLQRVCEVVALQMLDNRFENERVFTYALARHVLQLRSQKTWRPGGVLCRYLGALLRDELGVFPHAVLRQIEKDAEARRDAKRAFETGWQIRGEG